ncbi:hypothetical protein KJ359_012264 [Pestalotiopsis sp. 9143b]|nr:hypothetical protein KJ359_012264 [Pestalotiopsis sp. 9143b]
MDDSGAPNGDKASCLRQVLLLFRDIDQQHLDEVAEQHQFCPTATIAAILDQQEQGHQYPRRKGTLKRKRAVADVDEDGDEDDEDDEDDDGGGEIGGSSRSVKVKVDGPRTPSKAYSEMATKLLCQDFRNAPKPTVKKAMLPAHGNSLFKTYMTMDQETRNWNQDNPRWIPKKSLTKVEAAFLRSKIENIDRSAFDEAECLALDDFLAARRVRDEKDAEELNLEQAKENGAVQDCGCCFEEFPLNRMVHCEGNVVHWFCRKCMRQQAETVIGQGQHTITCLSMDACSAGYSHTQRKTFIDKKLQVALDRNEAQAALQAVGIENLETCPFCPMAMEYPPVAENKEFHCTNPRCEVVSCRLCRKRTHLPQTCAEAAADEGESARHAIEEAMSDAIIRKCNKCENALLILNSRLVARSD